MLGLLQRWLLLDAFGYKRATNTLTLSLPKALCLYNYTDKWENENYFIKTSDQTEKRMIL